MPQILTSTSALAPAALMAMVALLALLQRVPTARLWRAGQALNAAALAAIGLHAWLGAGSVDRFEVFSTSPVGIAMALLVQLLSAVIGGFSVRYLQGEPGQRRYIAAFAAVLAAVHLLLLANHWLVLITAWALVGMALQQLLCFYRDRPFARLAALKKRLADRTADVLLLGACALAWSEVGSGSLSALWAHLASQGMSTTLQLSAMALVLAVILRTALLPVHGWLIQVMEAPTPVSALLHAGVVNLGGFVLIRFAPLLEQAALARILLLVFGLATAVLAGMVMLTRISIKVRLAWSTVAQMGFMLIECALGLYTMAALHLLGHSLYKAHAFLSASTAVRQTRRRELHGPVQPMASSLAGAPVVSMAVVLSIVAVSDQAPWPWWWSAILGLAWAPLLWLSSGATDLVARLWQAIFGLLVVAGLTTAARIAHGLPLGIEDRPHQELGLVALVSMTALYLCLALLQLRPRWLSRWRRWSYAGFYVDEAYTRLTLWLWPVHWARADVARASTGAAAALLTDTSR